MTLTHDLKELSTAEEFLDYFGIAYDPALVQVNRLHILQRFHDYLNQAPIAAEQARTVYAERLRQAYEDFVASDARTEKVFKVFRRGEPQVTVIPLSQAFSKREE
ncbi:nitrogenase-stabilizing/protective protein NifW [Thiorhodospira sibirica]|uniref:nitrogenase-stabilizing/protective protein NifW n=1 Tax=Thiorhodospira sibirica TaxID=154347 RepID=UPI00022C057C|nr:nitrogenase-stabilizing/protective protein NifW [Thiorhodospira sibirica]